MSKIKIIFIFLFLILSTVLIKNNVFAQQCRTAEQFCGDKGKVAVCDRVNQDPVGVCQRTWFLCCDSCSPKSGCDSGNYADDGPIPTVIPGQCPGNQICQTQYSSGTSQGADRTHIFLCENLSCTCDNTIYARRCDNSNKVAVWTVSGKELNPCSQVPVSADGKKYVDVNGRQTLCSCLASQLDWEKGGGLIGWTMGDSKLGPECYPSPTPPVQVACDEVCSDSSQCPLECPLCAVSSDGTTTCQVRNPTSSCDNPCSSSAQCPLNCPICALAPDGSGSTCEVISAQVPQCQANCDPGSVSCPIECPVCSVGGGSNICQQRTSSSTCDGPCSSSNQCPQTCPICAKAPDGTSTCKVNDQIPDCNSPCTPGAGSCPIECPLCAVGPGGTNTCQVQAPPPSPAADCNSPCTVENNICPYDCPVCAPNPAGGSSCQLPSQISNCDQPCTATNQCPQDCPICAVAADGTSKCKTTDQTSFCNQPCTAGSTQCPIECPICAPSASGGSTCFQPNPTPLQACLPDLDNTAASAAPTRTIEPSVTYPPPGTAGLTNQEFAAKIADWAGQKIDAADMSKFITELARVAAIQIVPCDPSILDGCKTSFDVTPP